MLIVAAEIGGRSHDSTSELRMDLRCEGGLITEIASQITPRSDEFVLEARGGALIPGLQDHHIHLLALAADLASIHCGPPHIESRSELELALRQAQPLAGWRRGTGYFESVAGPLDRHRLDALAPGSPLRIQHRSGSMWFLNSAAIEALGLERDETSPGIERDAAGRATGRLFRADAWLRGRLPATPPPDLAEVGGLLARSGVTAVTDATAGSGAAEARLLRRAQQDGTLPQRIRWMGDLALGELLLDEPGDPEDEPSFEVGACKILLDEPRLPDLEELVARIRAAHAAWRGVAIHCVTRTEIHFALAALEAAGARPGDRIEHASVAPPEALAHVKRLGISIVTQPNFVAERGDAYRTEVDARDLPHLYRVRSWIDAGVPLAGGTDAPFGHPDPWRAMRAAVQRRTRSGEILGTDETVSPEVALSLFTKAFGPGLAGLASEGTPDSATREILEVGRRADLCLLAGPWHALREDLSSDHVVATLRGGELIWVNTR